LTPTSALGARSNPGARLWETTRPFIAVKCPPRTLPRRQYLALSLDFAAESVSPMSFGTTHGSNAATVRIAVGVELEAQRPAFDTWKTSAAPVP
jgi:hypothetical protein